MGYVIVMSIVVVAAFVCTVVVLWQTNEERQARCFAQLDPDKQEVLYGTPLVYDDDTQQSWKQKGLVRDIHPNSDGTTDVEVLWYNALPKKTVRKTETNVEHITTPQKTAQSKGVHKGDIVTIAVRPGQGVTIVA